MAAAIQAFAPRGRFLSATEIRDVAPSVFATQPHESRSDRYRFLATSDVLETLESRGFGVVQAGQTRVRDVSKRETTKHLLRLRHVDFLYSDRAEIPEFVLTNAHDGTGAYNFLAGLFRMVCANGMISQSEDFGSIRVYHTGNSDWKSQVIDASYSVMDHADNLIDRVDAWKNIELTPPERHAFASAMLEYRPINGARPESLLQPRRPEDSGHDLWTTTNVVQENTVRGGISGRSAKGRRTTTKPIKSVVADVKLNTAVMKLAETIANLKGV